MVGLCGAQRLRGAEVHLTPWCTAQWLMCPDTPRPSKVTTCRTQSRRRVQVGSECRTYAQGSGQEQDSDLHAFNLVQL